MSLRGRHPTLIERTLHLFLLKPIHQLLLFQIEFLVKCLDAFLLEGLHLLLDGAHFIVFFFALGFSFFLLLTSVEPLDHEIEGSLGLSDLLPLLLGDILYDTLNLGLLVLSKKVHHGLALLPNLLHRFVVCLNLSLRPVRAFVSSVQEIVIIDVGRKHSLSLNNAYALSLSIVKG